jgi:hypothetical protein
LGTYDLMAAGDTSAGNFFLFGENE